MGAIRRSPPTTRGRTGCRRMSFDFPPPTLRPFSPISAPPGGTARLACRRSISTGIGESTGAAGTPSTITNGSLDSSMFVHVAADEKVKYHEVKYQERPFDAILGFMPCRLWQIVGRLA